MRASSGAAERPGSSDLRILLIAPRSSRPPCLRDADGLRVITATGLTGALERLRSEHVDAVALHPDLDPDPLGIGRLRAALDGTPILVVQDGRHRGGSARSLDGALPADASADAVIRLVGAATELRRVRHQLADALRERDEHHSRFDALVHGNADGIMVVDASGVVRFANPMAGRLFGRSSSALCGSAFGHPLVAGETTEVDVLAPGQEPVVVEMRIVDVEWDGEPAYIACLRDVTDRKQAEEAARRLIRSDVERSAAEEASRRFRFLADAGAALVSSLDERATLSVLAHLCIQELADWAIVYQVDEGGTVRRAEVVHRDPARAPATRELRQQPLAPADCAPIFAVLRSGAPVLAGRVSAEQLAAAAPAPATHALIARLGLASYMLLPLSARNRQIGVLALAREDPERPLDEADLTFAGSLAARAALAVDNARLYQSARAADQAKSDLIAVISHDLRTPLNSIIGYADLIDMGVAGPVAENALDFVRRVRRSAHHQIHLIDQLLTFSRLDAGVPVRAADVDVRRLLEELQGMMEPLAAKAGLTLEVTSCDGLRLVTDVDALRQVLLNLVSNAIKYTERGGVRVEAGPDPTPGAPGAGVLFAVSDTGVGVAPEHRERIFDPFWQVDPERRRGGTGLGLSIVRRLVHLLGAEITVASEPGRGSTFSVQFPRSEGRPT